MHYFNKKWAPEGPYAAVVSNVQLFPGADSSQVTAQVDLTVFSNSEYKPVSIRYDVSGVGATEKHTYQECWLWPERI